MSVEGVGGTTVGNEIECQVVADALSGHSPIPVAAFHAGTQTWLKVDSGWLNDLAQSLKESELEAMSEPGGVDEFGWDVCDCGDCRTRRTITHILPRVLMAVDEGLVEHHRHAI